TAQSGAVAGRQLDDVLLDVEGIGKLRLRPAAGGLDRALGVPPGPRRLELRRPGAAAPPLLPVLEVDLAPDTAAVARLRLGPEPGTGTGAPWVASLASSRTSVATGERVALSARVEPAGRATPRWTLTPPGCGRLSPAAS